MTDLDAKRAAFRTELLERIPALDPAAVDVLVDSVQAVIAIDSTDSSDEDIDVGTSKLGGLPDLAGTEWPTFDGQPLTFVGQFNLEELRPYDVGNVLPTEGLLSVFGHVGREAEAQAILQPAGAVLNRASPPSDDPDKVLDVYALTFETRYQYASAVSPEHPASASITQADASAESCGIQGGSGLYSHLLGYEHPMETAVEAIDSTNPEHAPHCVLLRLDGQDAPVIGDLMALTFATPCADLVAGRFDRVRAEPFSD